MYHLSKKKKKNHMKDRHFKDVNLHQVFGRKRSRRFDVGTCEFRALQFPTTRHVFINFFQTEHFSAVIIDIGYYAFFCDTKISKSFEKKKFKKSDLAPSSASKRS